MVLDWPAYDFALGPLHTHMKCLQPRVKKRKGELAATCRWQRQPMLGQDLIERCIYEAHVLPSQGVSMFLDRCPECVNSTSSCSSSSTFLRVRQLASSARAVDW